MSETQQAWLLMRMEATFMSLSETEETRQYSFAPFAAHPFYTHINRSLVQQALASTTRPTGAKLTIVDMACGTGAITQLIAEEIALQRRQARIIGVDPSAEVLRLAQRKMVGMGVKATEMQWPTPEGYVSLLKQSGFGHGGVNQEQVTRSLDGLRDLGHSWLFIQGALPGAPLALGAAALGTAAYQAGQGLGMTTVPRLWLQIIATKRL
jgi:SAM-dependent methyltransferase